MVMFNPPFRGQHKLSLIGAEQTTSLLVVMITLRYWARIRGIVFDLELHFKGKPSGTISIKQEPGTVLVLDIEFMDLVPASKIVL